MKITVAGVVKEVKDNITISELIAQENVETPEYVTVSVNDEFAKSADFETQQLKDGDNVEFLYFKRPVRALLPSHHFKGSWR